MPASRVRTAADGDTRRQLGPVDIHFAAMIVATRCLLGRNCMRSGLRCRGGSSEAVHRENDAVGVREMQGLMMRRILQ